MKTLLQPWDVIWFSRSWILLFIPHLLDKGQITHDPDHSVQATLDRLTLLSSYPIAAAGLMPLSLLLNVL